MNQHDVHDLQGTMCNNTNIYVPGNKVGIHNFNLDLRKSVTIVCLIQLRNPSFRPVSQSQYLFDYTSSLAVISKIGLLCYFGMVHCRPLFNKICDLPLARMHDVHFPSEQLVAASHQEWNAIPNSIRGIIAPCVCN